MLGTMSEQILAELLDLANYLMMDELIKMIEYRQSINESKDEHQSNIKKKADIFAKKIMRKRAKKNALSKLGVIKTPGTWCLETVYDYNNDYDRNTVWFYPKSYIDNVSRYTDKRGQHFAQVKLSGFAELKPTSYDGFQVLEQVFPDEVFNGIIEIKGVKYPIINDECRCRYDYNRIMYCYSNKLFKKYGYDFCTNFLVVRAAELKQKLSNLELWYIGIAVAEWQDVHDAWQSFLDVCHKNNYATIGSNNAKFMIEFFLEYSSK